MNKPELVPGSFFEKGSRNWRQEREQQLRESEVNADDESADLTVVKENPSSHRETDQAEKISSARDRVFRAGSNNSEGYIDLNEKFSDLKRLQDLLTDAKLQLVSLRSLLEKKESLGWYQLIAKREVDEDISSAKFEINSRVEALNDFDIPNDLKAQLTNFQKELNFLANDKNTKPAGINKRLVLAISLSSQLISGCSGYMEKPRPDTSNQDAHTQVVMDGQDSEFELPSYSTPTYLSESPTTAELSSAATSADLAEPATAADFGSENTESISKETKEQEKTGNVYYPDPGVGSFKYWRRDVLRKAGLVEHARKDGSVPTTEAGFNVAPGTTFKVKVFDVSSGANIVIGNYEVKKGDNVWSVLEQNRQDIERQAKINGWENMGFEFSATQIETSTKEAKIENSQVAIPKKSTPHSFDRQSRPSSDQRDVGLPKAATGVELSDTATTTTSEQKSADTKKTSPKILEKRDDQRKKAEEALHDLKEKSDEMLKGIGLKPATPEQMAARKQRLADIAKAEGKTPTTPAKEKSNKPAATETKSAKQPDKKLTKAELAAKRESERKELESNKKVDQFARNATEIYKLEEQIKSLALSDSRLPVLNKKLEILKKNQAEQQNALRGKYKEALLRKAAYFRDFLQTRNVTDKNGKRIESESQEGFEDMLIRLRQELAQDEDKMRQVKIRATILGDKTAQEQLLDFEKNSAKKRQEIARLEKKIEEIRVAAIALEIASEDPAVIAPSETVTWEQMAKNIKSSAHGHLVDLKGSRDAYLPEAPEALENGLHRQESQINILINEKDLGILDLLSSYENSDDKEEKEAYLGEIKVKLNKANELASIQPKLDKKVEAKLKELNAIVSSFEGDNTKIETINREREDAERERSAPEAAFPSKSEKMLSYGDYSRQINKNKKNLDRARHRLTQVFNKDKKSSKDEKEIEKLRAQIDQYEAAISKAESGRGRLREQARIHVTLQSAKVGLRDLVKNSSRYGKEAIMAKLKEAEHSLMDAATDWRAREKDDKEADRVLKQVQNAIQKGGDLSEIKL